MTQSDDNNYRQLKKRILTIMILVPAVPFFLVLMIGYRYFTATLEENTKARMIRVAQDHSHAIETFLSERRSDLKLLADTYEFNQISLKTVLREVFEDLTTKSSAFIDLGVFNDRGTLVAYQGPFELAGREYAQAKWFQEVTKRGYYISNVFLGYRQIPHFVIAVAQDEKESPWVIRATIDPVAFSSLVEKVQIGKTGEAFIVDKEGFLQTQRRSGGNLLEKDPLASDYLHAQSGIRVFVTEPKDGLSYLWATTWLNDGNWLLVVRQAESDAFQSLHTATYLVVLVTILGGILIIGLAFYTTNGIIKRMEAVNQEKNLLGRQLVRAGRLAEIGEMSAGFAHEVNNPLQIINSEQNLALTILEDMVSRGEIAASEDLDEVLDCIRQIKIQVDRCGRITQSLLKFARQNEPVVELIDMAAFIPSSVSLVVNKARVAGIAIEQSLPEEDLLVRADAGQMQQVLVNLLNNAIDAVESKESTDGGCIQVSAQANSNQVVISVTDDGVGIPSDEIEKIFTPFYTTKPVGAGTGLGLPICFGIIDQMGGRMEVDSQAGKGTTISILLPAGRRDASQPH